MTSGVEACLNKRFETPELARIFNLRIDGEGRAARRRKKAKEDRDESVAERFMIDSMAGTEDPYELDIHRDFMRSIHASSDPSSTDSSHAGWLPDPKGWELRMKVGWHVFKGELGAARSLLSEHVAGVQAVQQDRAATVESVMSGSSASEVQETGTGTGARRMLVKRPNDAVARDVGNARSLVDVNAENRKPVRKRKMELLDDETPTPHVQVKRERSTEPARLAIPIRAVQPQASSMEDFLNRQAHILIPDVPLIAKRRRGRDPDGLTGRLSSKLLGMLDLSRVDQAEMAAFTERQTSRRYREAAERASRSSTLTPLPEDRESKPAIVLEQCARKAKASRSRPRNVIVKHEPEDEKPLAIARPTDVVVSDGGIRAKTYRAVMRLVLGLPLLPTAPRVRMAVPPRRPPVWAESRQELCEALPYYRSFQSSLYLHKGTAYSYLLDGYPSPRDTWAADGRVIISHGGGQCVRTTHLDGTPHISLQADQSPTDARVDALLRCERNRTPIILIAGEGYAQLPWTLPQTYAVLGWYWISHTWVEAEYPGIGVQPSAKGYFLRYKIRFDWVESQGVPWWLQDHKEDDWVADAPRRPIGHTAERAVAKQTDSTDDDVRNDDDTSLCRTQKRLWRQVEQEEEEDEEEDEELIEGLSERRITKHMSLPGRFLLKAREPSHWQETKQRSHGTICPACRLTSPQIYSEGWICLQPKCSRFWTLRSWPIPPGFTLTYSNTFLEHKATPRTLQALPFDVVPPAPHAPDEAMSVDGRILWRGWVCHRCGRANCRFRWEVWECKACGQMLAPLDNAVIPASALSSEIPRIGDADIHPGAEIETTLRCLPDAVVMCYKLPDKGGHIYHMRHQNLDWADDLFEAYQREANGTIRPLFERKPLKGTAIKGQLLAQHFAVNSGATYKYNVSSMSLTFADSPACVMQALDTIKARVAAVLDEDVPFNEILSVLYREGQKMSWHDDGEPGLGKVVSSLSLGSPAVMSWRPKAHRRGIDKFAMGLGSKGLQHPPIALTITLAHGDIVIMRGRRMQAKYDHRVVPTGLRVAATAREIDQDRH